MRALPARQLPARCGGGGGGASASVSSSSPMSLSDTDEISLSAERYSASARCCAGVVEPTGREYSLRRPAASKLRNKIIAFCSCTTAARFALRRRARPFSGSLFLSSRTNGKGNKAEALRLRSGDTGLMSWLGSALQAEPEFNARAARA